ncbi:hypothetical protein KIW84_013255 [Lathyrus oleraceus]|uniref:DUF659 domain-containing protein n=1 Tax=Pisum sativum TaxID=3888 RepID=A0A9D5BJV7_PEA|nr:hypothetical protein KIW84_013255 [Pisum sativum]
MLEMVSRHGLGFKPPSYHEIRTKYLKQKMEETTKDIEEHKLIWKKTGCTIMSDGWTDKRRRTILNFLVNSTKGTAFLKSIDASHISKTADKIFKMTDQIVEEVGEESVVQIVTDNAANYKVVGVMLMEKRNKLYWTPCAAHCIDLMLEDFEKKTTVHRDTITNGKKVTPYIYSKSSLISLLQHFIKEKDLVRPVVTRFATSYLTLGCLMENKGALIRMFMSNEWTLIDSDEKPATRLIYEALDEAKKKNSNQLQWCPKKVHTKRRNRLKQKTMNDVVFVMTNSKLAEKKKNRKTEEYKLDDIESDNEWIVNSDEDFENEILDFTIENEDFEVATAEGENGIDGATAEGENGMKLPLLKMNWRFITLMMSLMEKKKILALMIRMP